MTALPELSAHGERANLVVGLLVGLVFLPGGVKKFLFPEQWGAGGCARIGIPAPATMAHFVVGLLFLLLAGPGSLSLDARSSAAAGS